MGIHLEKETVCGLSWKGVLAYVAVKATEDGAWTTAQLAAAVGARTEQMREGLEEIVMSNLVVKGKNHRWIIGTGVEAVQILDTRRTDFIDDLKKIWDWANPADPFTMNAGDGFAVRVFLRQHKEWDRATWQRALRHRYKSEVNRAQRPCAWLGRLGEYLNCPLDKFGKPMEHGVGGALGQALSKEAGNRAAREAFTAANRL